MLFGFLSLKVSILLSVAEVNNFPYLSCSAAGGPAFRARGSEDDRGRAGSQPRDHQIAPEGAGGHESHHGDQVGCC